MALGFSTQLELLCCEQLCQVIKKYQKDGHGHDNHIVADAVKGDEKHVTGREIIYKKKHKILPIFN